MFSSKCRFFSLVTAEPVCTCAFTFTISERENKDSPHSPTDVTIPLSPSSTHVCPTLSGLLVYLQRGWLAMHCLAVNKRLISPPGLAYSPHRDLVQPTVTVPAARATSLCKGLPRPSNPRLPLWQPPSRGTPKPGGAASWPHTPGAHGRGVPYALPHTLPQWLQQHLRTSLLTPPSCTGRIPMPCGIPPVRLRVRRRHVQKSPVGLPP